MKLFIVILVISVSNSTTTLELKQKQVIVRKLINLHQNWYQQALEALLQALNFQNQKHLPKIHKNELNYCLRGATELNQKAKCVAKGLDYRDARFSTRSKWIGGFRIGQKRRKPRWFGNLKQFKIDYRYKRSIRLMPRFQLKPSILNPKQVISRILSRFTSSASNWRQDYSKLRRLIRFSRLSNDRQNLDRRSAKVLSPRFLSLIPLEPSTTRIISPDIFGLHNDGLLSLPNLLKRLNPYDRKIWFDFIMQASGASKSIKKILKSLEKPYADNERQKIFQTNMKIVKTWDKITKSYNKVQRNDLKTKGYAFLTKKQLLKLYGSNGLYNNSNMQLTIDLDLYGNMTKKEKQQVLEETVRLLAGEKNRSLKSWSRRLNDPRTLEPAVFHPEILSPGVLGPVTLSPSIFSPEILSPNALKPVTLSPSVGNPIILSPFVLSPPTLSPTVLSPIILSPHALAPLILSPYALSIAVLSPNVLSPGILSPSTLSGHVLSPKALSPEILSPHALNADVLSPSVLS